MMRRLTYLFIVLALWGGMVTTSAAQGPCRDIGAEGSSTPGREQVCQKPSHRKSWGQLLADYIGYRGYSKSYALVVGISNYTGGYTYLPTENDALKMRDFLINEAGFDYVHVLTDGRATISRIRELMIDVFPDRLDANDRFLFYWSGHGVTRGTSGFLPVLDTPENRYSRMISMDNIQQWNRYLKAKQSLFLLDACFGGLAGIVPKNPTTALTLNQLAQPSHHLLTAGTDKEEVIAGDRWQGSLFTAAVIDGLRGGADTESQFKRDGVVSLRELMVYIQKRVAVEKQQVGWKRSLTPQLRDLRSSDGEFFFITSQGKRETISKRGFEPTGASEFGEPVVVKSSRPAAPTPSSAIIKEVQEVLTALGYRPGPADGKLGIRTRGAILSFQQDSGLTPTGTLDEVTINQLAKSWGRQPKIAQPKASPTPPPPPHPKTVTNSIGMEFVLIPAGAFMMGTPKEQLDAIANEYDISRSWVEDESPRHRVTISQPFYMGKYEVTQTQWKAVMGDNPSQFKGDNRPVENVSWNDVQEFIKKLNTREGKEACRLSTEAEWEYAARAGTETRYSFGDDGARLVDYAWYDKNSGDTTHPVGQKKPNAWGLFAPRKPRRGGWRVEV